MSAIEPIVPPQMKSTAAAFRFSPAVRAGDWLYISGVVGRDGEGNVPPSHEEELHCVFREIAELLEEAGAGFDQIVSLDTFHVTTDFASDLGTFIKVRTAYMDGVDPAWTAIGIAQLGLPDARIEVRVTAYLGS